MSEMQAHHCIWHQD